jgi:predicted transcriptional regulator
MIAKELVNTHGLKQAEAAEILGVSQPAISLYYRKMRGKAINLEKDQEITGLVKNMATSMVKGKLSHREFIQKFCEICGAIRVKGLLCEMHKTLDPSVDIEKCGLCLTSSLAKCE